MADPLSSKIISKGVVEGKGLEGAAPEKKGPSKFDQVRVQLQQAQQASQIDLPQEVTKIPHREKKLLEQQLRQTFEQARVQDLREIFKCDLDKAKAGIADLTQKVSALPQSQALEPLRNRLFSLETQFADSGKLLSGLDKTNKPEDFLKLQLQMHQMTQNIEIMCKAVDQVIGGVKTLLQVNV